MQDEGPSAPGPGRTAVAAPTLVLGLGNPILGDDGVGWVVAQEVSAAISEQNKRVEVDCASLGGLSLMERILGYERVILVDSIESRAHEVGYVSAFPLEQLADPTYGHTGSAHDTSLLTAVRAAEAMGQATPTRIEIVAIEAKQSYDFSESLSAPVQQAVAVATRKVLELLNAAP